LYRTSLASLAIATLLVATARQADAGLVSGFASGSLNGNPTSASQSDPASFAISTSVNSGTASLNLFSSGSEAWNSPSSATIKLEDGFTFSGVTAGMQGIAQAKNSFTDTFTAATGSTLTFTYSATGFVINGPAFTANVGGQQFFIDTMNPLGTVTLQLAAGQSAAIAISSDINVGFPSPDYPVANYKADNRGTFTVTLTPDPVPIPEPSTLVMLCSALPVAAVVARRRWRKGRPKTTSLAGI
jgi:hypothetical protein